MNKIAIIPFITVVIVTSCNSNKLPQVDYADKLDDHHLLEILHYQDGKLSSKDSIIENFWKFHLKCRENLPEMDHGRWLYAISFDKRTPYHEIDSIFGVFEGARIFQIFLLANDINDTLGFILPLPWSEPSSSENYQIPDTLRFDNLIELKKDIVYLNGEQTVGKVIDYKIKEMIFKKEQVAITIDKNTDYGSLIKILSCYHKYRQHFKELYSELIFNKEYSWFYNLPIYFSDLKYEVDQEYKSKIYIVDTWLLSDRTVLVGNGHQLEYSACHFK